MAQSVERISPTSSPFGMPQYVHNVDQRDKRKQKVYEESPSIICRPTLSIPGIGTGQPSIMYPIDKFCGIQVAGPTMIVPTSPFFGSFLDKDAFGLTLTSKVSLFQTHSPFASWIQMINELNFLH